MRLARLGVIRVLLRERKSHIKQHELLGKTLGAGKQHEQGCEDETDKGSSVEEGCHGSLAGLHDSPPSDARAQDYSSHLAEMLPRYFEGFVSNSACSGVS